jgi:hypothetical protein
MRPADTVHFVIGLGGRGVAVHYIVLRRNMFERKTGIGNMLRLYRRYVSATGIPTGAGKLRNFNERTEREK